jgi:hypothetical protein
MIKFLFSIKSKKPILKVFHTTSKSLLLMSCVYSSSVFGGENDGKFDDFFSVDIYKQKEFRRTLPKDLTETQINQRLKEELLRQKGIELNKKCLAKITNKIDVLREKYELARNGEFWRKLLEQIGTTTMSATLIGGVSGGHMLGPGGELAGIAMGLFVGGSVLAITHKIEDRINIDPNRRASVEGIIKEIRDLSFEIMDLQHEVGHEAIMETEIKYINNKRKIKNKQLKREIEKGLIQARKNDFASDIIKNFIDLAICLPTGPKAIKDSRNKLIEKFNANKVFSSFDETVKVKLLNIITETADFSNIPDSSTLSKRKVYFFYGNPSCGKTTAAKEIPIFLDLPYFELTIRSEGEVSKDALEGSSRLRADVNVGWLVKPLLSTDAVGVTFSNGYLIINDLDRILMSGTEAQAQTILTFLLDYLDPGKKRFSSPFFNTNIDIHRLNIIITSNTKLTNTHFIKALKSRVVETEFPDFSSVKVDEIMRNYVEEYVTTILPNRFFTVIYKDSSKLCFSVDEKKLKEKYNVDQVPPKIECAIESLEDAGSVNLRELQMRTTSAIQSFLNRTTREGMILFNEAIASNIFSKNLSFNDLKSVLIPIALKGDKKALKILEKLKDMDTHVLENILNQFRTKNVNGSPQYRMQCAYNVGTYYYRTRQTAKAKKWFEISHSIGDIEIEKKIKQIKSRSASPKDLYSTHSDLWCDLLYFEALPKTCPFNKKLGKIFLNAAIHKMDKDELSEAYNLLVHSQNIGNYQATDKLYQLGEKYEATQGLGSSNAVKSFEMASKMGHAAAAFKLGWQAWLDGRFNEAFAYASLSNNHANNKYFWALWLLGNLYENGQGVVRNIALAFEIYNQAYAIVKEDELRKPLVVFKILSFSKSKFVTVSKELLRGCKISEVLKVINPVLRGVVKKPMNKCFNPSQSEYLVDLLPYPYGFFGVELVYLILADEMCKSQYFAPSVFKSKNDEYIKGLGDRINSKKEYKPETAKGKQSLVKNKKDKGTKRAPAIEVLLNKELKVNYGDTILDDTLRATYVVGASKPDGDCFFHACLTEEGKSLETMKQEAAELRSQLPDVVMSNARYKEMIKREWLAEEKLRQNNPEFEMELDSISDSTLRAYLQRYAVNTNQPDCYIQIPIGRGELSSVANVIAEFKKIRINCFLYLENSNNLLYKGFIGNNDNSTKVVNILLHSDHYWTLLNHEESEARKRGVHQAAINVENSRFKAITSGDSSKKLPLKFDESLKDIEEDIWEEDEDQPLLKNWVIVNETRSSRALDYTAKISVKHLSANKKGVLGIFYKGFVRFLKGFL